jgi:trans-aconitate methyltransferase
LTVWIVLAVIFCLFLSCEFYALKTGVPTVASFPSMRRKIIDILQKDFAAKPKATPYIIIDLGSGNGQLTWRIARALPDARVIGIELSVIPWLISALWQRLFGPANLEYRRADFWPYDCSRADAVVTYLTENIIDRVSQKLRDELKPGATVVANDVRLRGDWQPVETHDTGFLHFKVFIYRQT